VTTAGLTGLTPPSSHRSSPSGLAAQSAPPNLASDTIGGTAQGRRGPISSRVDSWQGTITVSPALTHSG
jgi:hypothetical protein